jgi:hypothetical protein
MYLNKNYVFNNELDLKQLFAIEDITERSIELEKDIKGQVEDINKVLDNKKEPNIDLGEHCVKPYDCPFFKYCTKKLVKPNVFDIRGMRYSSKVKCFENGVISFKELLSEKLNPKYLEQVDFEVNEKEDKIEKDKIKAFLKTLSYPLYFLDFETFQEAVPSYDGLSPYEQIPFQYSLHYYEEENSELKHKEFLAQPDIDPSRALADSLVRDIPLDVFTLAYNMSFEKNVIKSLAVEFPDLRDHLLNIHDHIKDLMVPFYNREYYTRAMQGSYSIKYVLPALFPDDPSLNYHNLEEVHNGGEAMNAYATMGSLSKEEQNV